LYQGINYCGKKFYITRLRRAKKQQKKEQNKTKHETKKLKRKKKWPNFFLQMIIEHSLS